MSSYNVRASDDESTEDKSHRDVIHKMYVLYTIISNSQMSKFIHCTKLSTSCSILSRIKLSCFLVFLFPPPPNKNMAERATTKSNRSAAFTPAESALGEASSYKDILLGKFSLWCNNTKTTSSTKCISDLKRS